jgi:hypothetical protein
VAEGGPVTKHLVLGKSRHGPERVVEEDGPNQPIRNAKCLLNCCIFIRPSRRKIAVFEGGESPVHRAEVFGTDPRREGWVPKQIVRDLGVCYWSR